MLTCYKKPWKCARLGEYSVLLPLYCSKMSEHDQDADGFLKSFFKALKNLFEAMIGLLKVGWQQTPSKYGRGSILRKSKELCLIGATEIQYEPLPGPTWIRLLNIEAASSSSIVRCSLRQFDLSFEPSYTALSYTWKQDFTWVGAAYSVFKDIKKDFLRGEDIHGIKVPQNTGEPQRSKVIICNRKVTKIHSNLYDALVQLRQRRAGKYWIDALCINQRYHQAGKKAPYEYVRLLRK
jgi:hypothetical protein